MGPTVRDITDLAVSVLDDMGTAEFPAAPVIRVIQPALDARAANYERMSRRTGLVEVVAPNCRQSSVTAVRNWFQDSPSDNPWISLMSRAELMPATAAELSGGLAAWRRSGLRQLHRDLGAGEHLVVLPLTATGSEVTGFTFSRSGRQFTAADLRFLGGLLPLLQAAARHTERLARWQAGYPDGQPGLGARGSGLTPRELAVLELAARGLTAAATGRRLGCSPRTVQKHLDHVYRKLGVNDRVSAVIEAQYRGLIRPPRARAAHQSGLTGCLHPGPPSTRVDR